MTERLEKKGLSAIRLCLWRSWSTVPKTGRVCYEEESTSGLLAEETNLQGWYRRCLPYRGLYIVKCNIFDVKLIRGNADNRPCTDREFNNME